MIEKDTIRLLRECDAGVRMAISSLEKVIPYTENPDLKSTFEESLIKHKILEQSIKNMLNEYHDKGKSLPNFIRKAAEIKLSFMLKREKGDSEIVSMISKGCYRGIKSLNHYLKKYKAASLESKNLTKDLASIERCLIVYLTKKSPNKIF